MSLEPGRSSTSSGTETAIVDSLSLQRDPRFLSDLIAILFMGFIAAVASALGAIYVLFPELGALSWDVFGRPRGRWAAAPLLLALTPALTGTLGTVVTRSIPYGFASVMLIVVGSVGIIAALDSPIAPAISAGLLPLVLGVTSWLYPPGILFGSTLLAALSIPWKRRMLADRAALEPSDASDSAEGSSAPPARRWLTALLSFVLVAELAVRLTGMRFILFPPLVVILYEMLRHPGDCPWTGNTVRLPIVCFIAAAGGYFFHAHIGFVPLAAILSMAWGVATLRATRVHVPPALAVALLPMVMGQATIGYPIAVGLGTTLASLWYIGFARWTLRTSAASAV